MTIKITTRPMSMARGAWAGTRPNWWTATDEASGFSITWHECASRSQHHLRQTAVACLEMLVDDLRPDPVAEWEAECEKEKEGEG